MIDGVKLLCNLKSSNEWTDNKNLSFRSWTDTQTGEVTGNNRHANAKGFHLSIIEGKKDLYCNARGSLPVYFTGGETNAIDYCFRDFLTTTQLLYDDLKIDSEKAVLRGFEFGVNISLPFDTKKLYECIKSYKMHSFGQYEENGKRMGIVFDLQQYRIKIYDKEMQVTGSHSRLLRFEIGVKKMDWVKKLGIKTLADLKNKTLWAELSTILLNVWNEIIFIDRSLQYRLMSNHQQKKYLRFLDVSYWCGLNKNTYYKAKNDLQKLQSLFNGKENTKQLIADLIAEKCQKLATETQQETGDYLTEIPPCENSSENAEILQRLKNEKWRLFNHLNKGIVRGIKSIENNTHSYPLNNTKNTDVILTSKNRKISKHEEENARKNITVKKITVKKIAIKKSRCMSCKESIREKKAGAKFCSPKCKNQYNGKRRTRENRRKRKKEIENLSRIIKQLPKTDLSLIIVYQSPERMLYADRLKQSEIKASSDWIRQVTKVVIESKGVFKETELTTVRAKRLIKEIVKRNEANVQGNDN
ncbi:MULTISPECIES: hypothetical protein [unclassified Chryseobacterium]|uniref:hypothetical protein n=1 Tax=unclassified Chryseobacterium TaxID=2593645 RepID=UPI000D356FA7|nr:MULTISPECIES: hypothetical protein [unclassified Chryseobacterium]PTT77194.1 hypothetical protein DBR25_03820 [Chryseobacterium sp. HMWF001]PVV54801.1 hypothetical protein DD829_16405 [Chryseobacterium sp. HMWF035]